MRILLFATSYLDLCKNVEDELRSQGHEVCVINDPLFPGDPKLLFYTKHKSYTKWLKTVSDFWNKYYPIISTGWDEFICINGYSISKQCIDSIREKSLEIKCSLYIWDSLNYADFNELSKSFDFNYSFDIRDCLEHKQWQLLPSFWIENEINSVDKQSLNYKCFCVGTNHDGRYKFIKEFIKEYDKHKFCENNYIKVLIYPLSRLSVIKRLVKDLFLGKLSIRNFLFEQGIIDNCLSSTRLIPHVEYLKLLRESEIIIDDNRPNQAGLSPRFIWSVALNKKIITTNKWCYDYSFVNKNNVYVIDKERPALSVDFMLRSADDTIYPTIEFLRIDNWCKILLRQINLPNFIRIENQS